MRSIVNINRFSIIILAFIIYSNPVIAQWNKALHFTYMEHDYLIADTGSVLWPTTVNAGTLEMWFRPDSILKSDTHPPDYTFLFDIQDKHGIILNQEYRYKKWVL